MNERQLCHFILATSLMFPFSLDLLVTHKRPWDIAILEFMEPLWHVALPSEVSKQVAISL